MCLTIRAKDSTKVAPGQNFVQHFFKNAKQKISIRWFSEGYAEKRLTNKELEGMFKTIAAPTRLL
jgi:outer membrane translocation and assembly module TamA